LLTCSLLFTHTHIRKHTQAKTHILTTSLFLSLARFLFFYLSRALSFHPTYTHTNTHQQKHTYQLPRFSLFSLFPILCFYHTHTRKHTLTKATDIDYLAFSYSLSLSASLSLPSLSHTLSISVYCSHVRELAFSLIHAQHTNQSE